MFALLRVLIPAVNSFRPECEDQAISSDEHPAQAQHDSVLSLLRQPHHAPMFSGRPLDSLWSPSLHRTLSSRSPHPQLLSEKQEMFSWFLLDQPCVSPLSSSAGSVHLTDLLHRGGRGAGDAPAEQLQTHPPDLQPRRLCVQRSQSPHRRGSWVVRRVGTSASNRSAGKPPLQTLTPKNVFIGFYFR